MEGRKNKRSAAESSSTSSELKKRKSDELNDMKKLECNDEAFFLSYDEIKEIIDIIHSRKTPTPETYKQWDVYATSFYLKMCICFNVDYQDLEATPEGLTDDDDDENVEQNEYCAMTLNTTRLKVSSVEEYLEKMGEDEYEEICCLRELDGPIEFGSYSTKPKLIPYHLYLLVKEAVDNMNNNAADLLELVECKISFFCTFFHTHLPTGWNYTRDKASSLISGYDTMVKPTDLMSGFTPFERLQLKSLECDDVTDLSPLDAALIMTNFYSRITPSFWKMYPGIISFYCKLCSCFGIKDYHCLENASEDDVCLMKVGLKPGLYGVR